MYNTCKKVYLGGKESDSVMKKPSRSSGQYLNIKGLLKLHDQYTISSISEEVKMNTHVMRSLT